MFFFLSTNHMERLKPSMDFLALWKSVYVSKCPKVTSALKVFKVFFKALLCLWNIWRWIQRLYIKRDEIQSIDAFSYWTHKSFKISSKYRVLFSNLISKIHYNYYNFFFFFVVGNHKSGFFKDLIQAIWNWRVTCSDHRVTLKYAHCVSLLSWKVV